MQKFSGLGRAKSFELYEAREFISSSTGFLLNSAIWHLTKQILINNDQLSRADIACFASIRLSYVSPWFWFEAFD